MEENIKYYTKKIKGYKTIASCCGHTKLPPNIIFMYNGEQKIFRILNMEKSDKLDKILS